MSPKMAEHVGVLELISNNKNFAPYTHLYL